MQTHTIGDFINNCSGHNDNILTFKKFFNKSVQSISPKLTNRLGSLNRFWLDPFYYILIVNWNNFLTEIEDFRESVTRDFSDGNSTNNQALYDNIMVYNILYKVYIDLYQFINFKSFFDKSWKDLWDYYFNISDLFKNLCEKNNQKSKLFFNGFKLAIKNYEDDASHSSDGEDNSVRGKDLNSKRVIDTPEKKINEVEYKQGEKNKPAEVFLNV